MIAGELPRLQYDLEKAILSLDQLAAQRLAASWRETMRPLELVEQIITPVLVRLSLGWEDGRVALSQIYMGGRICEEIIDALLPAEAPGRLGIPRIAIASFEDHHRLGKRLVCSTLRAAGFDVVDYGFGTAEDLPARALTDRIDLLLISTLLLPSALRVRKLIQRLDEIGAPTRVIVGGAPFLFDRELWRAVGAHAMGRDAADALTLVRSFAEGMACQTQ